MPGQSGLDALILLLNNFEQNFILPHTPFFTYLTVASTIIIGISAVVEASRSIINKYKQKGKSGRLPGEVSTDAPPPEKKK